MAPHKPEPESAVKIPSKTMKVTKSKAKKIGDTTGSSSVLVGAANETYRVKRYRNGILNLEKTPAHLVAVAKRNAIESHLLRLPAEIRNRIWSLAMSYHRVLLPHDTSTKGHAVSIHHPNRRGPDWITSFPYEMDQRIEKLQSAFHLPEVCRQIYSETALTACQQSTFIFEYYHMTTKNAITHLMAAQRRAIESIQIAPSVLDIHLSKDFLRRYMSLTHRNKLPNLKTIVVPRAALGYLRRWRQYSTKIPSLRGDNELRAHIVRKLKAIYSDHVEVEFEDEEGAV